MQSLSRFSFLPLLNLQNPISSHHIKQIHAQLITNGLKEPSFFAKLIENYCLLSSPQNTKYARLIFKLFHTQSLFLFNTLLRCSQPKDSIITFAYWVSKGLLVFDDFTYIFVLGACARSQSLSTLWLGRQVHVKAFKSGLMSNLLVKTTLIHFYANNKDILLARSVFDEMTERSSATWNAMIKGYTSQRERSKKCCREALVLFRDMLNDVSGQIPTDTTMVCVLSACSQLGEIYSGACVHGFIEKTIWVPESDVFIGTGLVDMYAKCGYIDSALSIFRLMSVKNVLTWTAMGTGLAVHGRGKEALELLDAMEDSGIKPNPVTFTSLFSACCHTGLVEEGLHLFHSMRSRFGLEPQIQHYGCIVDLLGRAGYLNEAYDFIIEIPIKPDAVLWRSLLSACTIHGDLAMAEKVGKILLRLEPPKNSLHMPITSEDYIALGVDGIAFLGISRIQILCILGRFFRFQSSRNQNLKMEDMDIDSIVDIPDTPERLSSHQVNGGNFIDKESSLSVAGHVGGSSTTGEESLDRQRGRGRLLPTNGHNRKHYVNPLKLSGSTDEIERLKNTIFLSPPECTRENAPLFRKTATARSRNCLREQEKDKGKAPCSKLPSKSSGFQEDHTFLDLTEQRMHNQIPEMEFLQSASENCLTEGRTEGQMPTNGGSYASRTRCKGKEKVEVELRSIGSDMSNGKGVDLSHGSPLRIEKQFPASHQSVVSPRAVGKRRLVRNGCISPHNIAIRAKQNEQSQSNFRAEQNFDNVVSSSPCMLSEIVTEDNNSGKGKGVAHPHTPKEHDINVINLSSSPMSNNGEASGFGDVNRDACFEEKGGWRSTHNFSKNVDDTTGHHLRRFNNVGCQASQRNDNGVVKRNNASRGKTMIQCDSPQIFCATETAPVISNIDQISESSRANMLPKRQTKHGLTSRNNGESSRVTRNDSDIVFLGSSRVSSSSRSSNFHIAEHLDVLDLDNSPELRGINANNTDSVNDEDAEAKARQLEADEKLARELQEQLYHEIDENIAWTLQQEEDALHPTFRTLHEPDHRVSTRQSRMQPPLRNFQNSSNRRGVQTHFPTSARVSRLRNRILNQPRMAPSRTRNFQFPLDMDLDMRLDILEAMEAAIGDSDDMGMASHIFQIQRDFNENDYEMLLALDDNNHQHGGASINQINSLPLSKVQTDNFEEACAICLETPAIGETIRHLPCLHKFHKDCIDPWLSRKTSCPVCKSSIT